MTLDAMSTRVRRLDRGVANRWFAVLVGVEMQVEAALLSVDPGARWAAHALLAVMALAVAGRRRLPVVSLAAAMAVFVLVQALGRDVAEHVVSAFFLTLFLTFSAAVHAPDRRFALVPLLAAAGWALGMLLDDYRTALPGDVLFPALIGLAGPIAGGRLLRHRARLHQALREKAQRSERERARSAERAALEERARIAAELHDVVAHALGGMTVQAAAARRLAHREQDAARAALLEVEAAGRQALGELRQLLGVLRRDDEDLALTPQPTLAHLSTLIARFRASGLPVDLRREGEGAGLPSGVDLTAYRVVQEALGAALAAGAGRAAAVVRHLPGVVEIVVEDDGPTGHPAAERPLLGMRERVGLVGGELVTGPDGDDGHWVRARIPVRLEVAA